jgi:enoyl-[acyl-carrier protein] reductase II
MLDRRKPSEASLKLPEVRFERLTQRGREFLGTEYAVMAGAMSWVSERHLVSAISNAGGFGVIACGAMTPELLTREIAATQELTAKPFGVNLITMHPALDELIQVCVRAKVSHVVFAGGFPSSAHILAAKQNGAKVVAFASALVMAKRLIKFGVDALVIEGSEAGGHIGPVSLSVLAQEILPFITEVPVFVAGGIGRGEAMLAYLQMGAAGAQLGTLFAACSESIAHENFKKAFIHANARDALPSVQIDERFPVIPVRGLINEGTKRFMRHQAEVLKKYQDGDLDKTAAQLEIEHFWAGALRRAVIDGDVDNGSVMAGQSVGMVTETLPVAGILALLRAQAITALATRADRD